MDDWVQMSKELSRLAKHRRFELSECRYLSEAEILADPVIIREKRRAQELKAAEDIQREVLGRNRSGIVRKPWPMKCKAKGAQNIERLSYCKIWLLR